MISKPLDRMKILHVLPYLPTPPQFGGAMRIYHLLKHLRSTYEVYVIAYGDNGDEEEFYREFPELEGRSTILRRSDNGRRVRFQQLRAFLSDHSFWYTKTFSKQMQEAIDQVTNAIDLDLILFEFPMLGQFQFPKSVIRVMDSHNVEYHLLERMSSIRQDPLRKLFYLRESKKMKYEEEQIAASQDALFVTSASDASLFDEMVPHVPKIVVPNGVDVDFYTPAEPDIRNPKESTTTLVFSGMMGYVPNYDAMLYFIDEIFPIIQEKRPYVRLRIVGKNPPEILKKKRSQHIEITGFVSDVRPYIQQSDLYVVPLRMGGGTRLKILQAMAMKIPIISTTIGAEGLEAVDGTHLLLRDDPQSFAEATLELMDHSTLKKQLAESAYQFVREEYDWKTIGGRIDAAFHYLMQQKNGRVATALLKRQA